MYTNKPKHMVDGTGDHPLGGAQEASCALSARPALTLPFWWIARVAIHQLSPQLLT